jgi:membrane protease YdiL (CAAX protease family)
MNPAARWNDEDERPRRKTWPSPFGFLVTCGFYGALLWSMIGYVLVLGIYLGFRYRDYDSVPRHVLKDHEIASGVFLGGLHALLVLAAGVITWRPRPLQGRTEPALAWVAAIPALVAMLMVNFGYGLGLRFVFEVMLGVTPEPDDGTEIGMRDGWIAVLLICVQPAIVEEVFFRFLLLGHLRTHVGLHAAVWVTSVFFAAAHLGQIAGMPVLLLLGAVMGYARVYSGGLALPMLLHFFHNLAVIAAGPAIEQIRFS